MFDKIEELKNFSEYEAAQIMKQILNAVSFCHERNIAHRDLSPETIILENESLDSLKIIDFSLATKFDERNMMKELVGTSYNVAPEIVKCK